MKRRNEFAIGVSVTAATIVVIFGILFLERPDFLKSGLRLELVVDSAEGIGNGSAVLYRGVRSGTVQSVSLDQKGVIVAIKVNRTTQIPSDSTFSIGTTSVLGGKVVRITPGNASTYLKEGARVEVKSSSGSNLLPGNPPVEGELQSLISNVDALTGKDVQQNLEASLANLRTSSKSLSAILEANQGKLAELLDSLESTATQAQEPLQAARDMLEANQGQVTAALKQTRQVASDIDAILFRLREGEGTLGQALTDKSLYRNLNDTLRNLDALVTDIRDNPKKYFNMSLF